MTSPTHEDGWEKSTKAFLFHLTEEFARKTNYPTYPVSGNDWTVYTQALLQHISSLLVAEERKVRANLQDWVEMMWNFDEFDHDDWAGSDEVLASIQSYLEGKHRQ